ncbi:11610_t:CDS:2 [Diversispora eburnea]|uniref:11610_t:CDS:1 n=1 Tax=Diversispora eburnea TaxID=1213867 RepID=A0A9N9G2R8_9GLOM|nr:11610_t:CDS:2 [Diversispora eburnea]
MFNEGIRMRIRSTSGPRPIHELNEGDNKIDDDKIEPFYNNNSRDDIADLSDNAKETFELDEDDNKIDDDIADPYSNVIKNKDIYRTMPYSRNDDITDLSRKYFLQPNAEDLKETSKLAF